MLSCSLYAGSTTITAAHAAFAAVNRGAVPSHLRAVATLQNSICAPIFKKRGVNTDNGASHACDPVVAVGLNDWLYVRIAAELVTL